MSWMTLARWGGPLLAFAIWTGGVYWFGLDAGGDSCRAEAAPAVVTAVKKDKKRFDKDVAAQREAEGLSERRGSAVGRTVKRLIEEGRNDPTHKPAPCDAACVERLRADFEAIDAAARDAAGAAGAGGS